MLCLVVYDIPDDAARTHVADVCLDYGLQRIQFSAFMGDISPNHQEELFLKIRRQVGNRAANVQLFPICDRDLRRRRVLENRPKGVASGAIRTPDGAPERGARPQRLGARTVGHRGRVAVAGAGSSRDDGELPVLDLQSDLELDSDEEAGSQQPGALSRGAGSSAC